MLPLLYILFILSGAAGLFYEAVWSRYLSLFVGHGAYAQVIVLVIFLGGMAIGAALVSRVTARLRDPLYGYALVELAVGLLGLAFHDGLYVPVTNWAYASLFPSLGGGFGVIAIKWVLAGALILPQSVLLGATFPLMSAGVLRRAPSRPGTVISWLYFANSLGAAVGVLVAGFYIVRLAGLPGTLIAAAIINLLVGLAALVLSKTTGPSQAQAAEPEREAADYPVDLDLVPRSVLGPLLLAVSAGTAIASFVYEIAWIRLLSLVLGSATHSFELMLSAFILGLALGAFWIRKRAETLRRPLLTLAWVQIFMGMLAAASLALYEWSFYWTSDMMAAVARTDQGYTLFTLARYGICLVIMLPATFCAGMTLPLITRSLLVKGKGEAAIGMVYGVNTAGSIVGAGVASLVAVPLLGLKGTLLVGATLDMALGLSIGLLLLRHGAPVRQLVTRGAVVTVLVPLLVSLGVRLDRALLTSGVFRTGHAGPTEDSIVYYRDGRTATVASSRSPAGRLTIATNGKPDGSLDHVWLTACTGDSLKSMRGDDPTQYLIPIITLAHRPQARTAAVIGHGTGMSSHALLASPRLESLVTVEIEPAMVAASRAFYPANRRVFDDPRARHAFDDAKAYFAAANRRYDVIVAEPSNPWVSGVSGLFTDEFYRRIGLYLNQGGVLGQWLHTYELTDELVLSVLAAIHRNFSDWAIYSVNLADFLIVATPHGPLPAPDWSVFGLPKVRADVCHFHPIQAQDLAATRLTSRGDLGPLLDQIEPNSDFYPVLDLGAERARFLSQAATGIELLFEGIYDFAGGPTAHSLPAEPRTESALAAVPRMRALLTSAALRAKRGVPRGDTVWVVGSRDDVDARVLLWLRTLESEHDVAPDSWAVWVRSFTNAFDLWHSGTRRWVDTGLVAAVNRYLLRHRAPEPVRQTVAFRVALAKRDWKGAAGTTGGLLREAEAGRYWIDPDALREGGVIAFVALGQPDSAARLFRTLEGRVGRPRGDLRTRLLRSYVRALLQDP